MSRQISERAIALIRKQEGCKLKAYECERSKRLPPEKKFWTIGWGHTGPDVKEGMVITQERAEELFAQDLAKMCKAVELCLRVGVSDNQFSALVSLTYNIGPGAFHGSTLLKKLNAGNFIGAANEFLDWKYIEKHVSEDLVQRRRLERDLFLDGFVPKLA